MRLSRASSWFFAMVLAVLGANAFFLVLIARFYDTVETTQTVRQNALALADEVYLGAIARPEKLKPEERFDVEAVIQHLATRSPTSAELSTRLSIIGTSTPLQAAQVADIDPLRASFNNTFEVGYKGRIGSRVGFDLSFSACCSLL